MTALVFYLLILIPVAGFAVERLLDFLNSGMWSDELPAKLAGICNEEEYRQSQLYERDNKRLSFWSALFNLAVIICMIAAGGFAAVDRLAGDISSNHIITALLFFAIIGFLSDLINIPFTCYDTFILEKRYGFNKTSVKTFISDHIKTWLMAVVIGAPVFGVITWFYYNSGNRFWLWAWAVITLFSVFISYFYSELIVPLFNRQKPLPEGDLRTSIEAFSEKVGFRLGNIFIIDGSKRSTKANAYFTGFGPKKRIVLYDTILNDLTGEEIVAVLAHEIGHYKKKHVLFGLLSSILVTGIMLFIFSLVSHSPVLARALGSGEPSFHMGLVAFGILYTPLAMITGLVSNYISRRNEFSADNFSGENYSRHNLASALKKLAVKNLSNMMPHPAYVFFHYSHPPLLSRLEKLEGK
jgi:STE24 endopeptidase